MQPVDATLPLGLRGEIFYAGGYIRIFEFEVCDNVLLDQRFREDAYLIFLPLLLLQTRSATVHTSFSVVVDGIGRKISAAVDDAVADKLSGIFYVVDGWIGLTTQERGEELRPRRIIRDVLNPKNQMLNQIYFENFVWKCLKTLPRVLCFR